MKTLKILNKVSKIVVTKLKINTVLCKDWFLLLEYMRPPYILRASIGSVPHNTALKRSGFQTWWLKSFSEW